MHVQQIRTDVPKTTDLEGCGLDLVIGALGGVLRISANQKACGRKKLRPSQMKETLGSRRSDDAQHATLIDAKRSVNPLSEVADRGKPTYRRFLRGAGRPALLERMSA
jgi:hypothetical protein